ncbi:MAG: metallophosphatase family protein [Anaerolineae bacterium]|nr:metallophosphatase family protein [Anaerolineae bacterium]
MTRIVILADIHANLHAFEAVQADIPRFAPDLIIVNGDMINRGPQSLECLEAVRATGWPVVYGNHEEYAIMRQGDDYPDEWKAPFFEPFQEVANALSAEQIAFIKALPRFRVVEVPGLPALYIVHGSPFALNDGLGHWLSEDELRERLDAVEQPVMIGAHTHRPFDQRIGSRRVLNCSAVGIPYNGDPRAQYLVLTGRDGDWHAEWRYVAYDRERIYAAYAANGSLKHAINHLFMFEVETSTFHFAPYRKFCEDRGLDREQVASISAYRDFACDTKPGRSMKPVAPHPNGD